MAGYRFGHRRSVPVRLSERETRERDTPGQCEHCLRPGLIIVRERLVDDEWVVVSALCLSCRDK